ncbi:MAG: hypothetical protein K0Q47_1813 [Sedimentibacter sp.]|jgi:hypothetical protein|nr:hypothetical protein [Sedimentibacter sp.]
MELIIVLILIALYFAGFKFIDNIYNLASPCKKNPFSSKQDESLKLSSSNDKIVSEVLIYGNEDYCFEISAALKKYNLSSEMFKDLNELNMSNSYKFLIAAGNSDLDNLTICSIGTKMMEIYKAFAVCNQTYSKKLYEENNIFIFNSCCAADDIARAVATFS